MKELAIRLSKGADLKQSIINLCKDVDSAVVLSSVGCVSKLSVRLAGASDFLDVEEDFEILSINGTISKGKAHLHICCSDVFGNSIGGHLMDGTIVNTTCELVIGILEEYESNRTYDPSTGYDEIEFKKI